MSGDETQADNLGAASNQGAPVLTQGGAEDGTSRFRRREKTVNWIAIIAFCAGVFSQMLFLDAEAGFMLDAGGARLCLLGSLVMMVSAFTLGVGGLFYRNANPSTGGLFLCILGILFGSLTAFCFAWPLTGFGS